MALVGLYVVHPTRGMRSCHAKRPCIVEARLLGYSDHRGPNGYITPDVEGVWIDNCSRCAFCLEWINWADRVEPEHA